MSTEDLTSLLIALKELTFRIADAIDRQADALAATIRDNLSNSPWLPPSARPAPPHITPPARQAAHEKVLGWIWRHRYAAVAVGIGIIGAGSYGFLAKRQNMKKRRARRAANGARKEVVVVVGEPHELLTRSLVLDLERRGFVVFVVVGTSEDEKAVLNEGRGDIKPLFIDLDPEKAQMEIAKFQTYLSTPTTAFQGAAAHKLSLAGVILIPSPTYPSGPLETLPPDLWSDTLNVKILSPIVTLHHFLPMVRAHKSRILLLTSSIIPSLSPAFHAPESLAVNALDTLARSLRRELNDSGVAVCLLKLGLFESPPEKNSLALVNAARADILGWPLEIRGTYARRYAAQAAGGGIIRVRGSAMRELMVAVFDALEGHRSGVRWVGRGAGAYALAGWLLPESLVGWMLGLRGDRVVEEEEWKEWERV